MEPAIHHCSAQAAKEALSVTGGCQLIDVREYSEYASERVPGTTHAPLSRFGEHVDKVSKEKPVYLLCRSGSRAEMAAKNLIARGYTDVRVVEGGIQSWMAAGFPVEKGSSQVWSIDRQVRFTAGSLVLLGLALSWAVHPAWLILSAFVGGGLLFSGVTNFCGMALVLGRMPWNQAPKGVSCTSNSSI